jgi:hypothetical protein
MKSFEYKSDYNQKYLEISKQFGSSTNTRWQGFSEKFSPDILNEEIDNQIIGKDYKNAKRMLQFQNDKIFNPKI